MMRANNVKVVLGSALLWAWGFLCFLSPALFPERGGLDASIGLEYGFFASQASVLVCAGVVVLVSRWRRFIVKRGAFFVAALLVALTTLVLTWAVRADALAVIVACGVIDGGAVMLLGVAWGARYSLGSRRMRSLVVLSFLVAYLLYLVVAQIPGPTSIALVCALPLASWALWRSDAVMRHELSSEVFPSRAAAVPVGGALVQGSAFFLQVLVFLVITQSTQELGLSPLLSFSVGQGLVSGVVFAGNVVGKQVYALFGSGDFVLDVMCGLGLLALFFMLVRRAGEAESAGVRPSADSPALVEPSGDPGEPVAADPESVVLERATRFAQSYGLTNRETEVLGYLARGRTLPYIADALFVTTGTVKTHTTHIYRKLDVNSRQELLDQLDAFG